MCAHSHTCVCMPRVPTPGAARREILKINFRNFNSALKAFINLFPTRRGFSSACINWRCIFTPEMALVVINKSLKYFLRVYFKQVFKTCTVYTSVKILQFLCLYLTHLRPLDIIIYARFVVFASFSALGLPASSSRGMPMPARTHTYVMHMRVLDDS